MKKYKYICEVCGKKGIFDSPEEAYEAGWDFPPYMGTYGVISQRTCPDCTIDQTLYWRLMTPGYELNSHDLEIIDRINKEPEIFEIEV